MGWGTDGAIVYGSAGHRSSRSSARLLTVDTDAATAVPDASGLALPRFLSPRPGPRVNKSRRLRALNASSHRPNAERRALTPAVRFELQIRFSDVSRGASWHSAGRK
ncbi:hypothetical protein SKAU_G00043790 [Synaphobranchus kaupii]|uniref:Uncharacterized protein n=1 Tax=Synaphobranchus kaupii TaxID=118154 RepID=A0A9Q1J6W5_SYNKA|nr:hypothetical protein SKAU_G00043790 [Synaphobranchus kaupii]